MQIFIFVFFYLVFLHLFEFSCSWNIPLLNISQLKENWFDFIKYLKSYAHLKNQSWLLKIGHFSVKRAVGRVYCMYCAGNFNKKARYRSPLFILLILKILHLKPVEDCFMLIWSWFYHLLKVLATSFRNSWYNWIIVWL